MMYDDELGERAKLRMQALMQAVRIGGLEPSASGKHDIMTKRAIAEMAIDQLDAAREAMARECADLKRALGQSVEALRVVQDDRDAARLELADLREELQALLDDWNAIVRASGSRTNGGATAVVVGLLRERDRLRAELAAANRALRTELQAAQKERRRLAAQVRDLADNYATRCVLYEAHRTVRNGGEREAARQRMVEALRALVPEQVSDAEEEQPAP